MKKLFTLFALCAMTFVACDSAPEGPGAPSNQNLTLKITSSSIMHFEVAGGAGQITFDLVEETEAQATTRLSPVEPPIPEAKTNADWVSNFIVGDGVIDFVVAENEGKERSASITVKYGNQSAIVMLMQEGLTLPDATFTATHLGGGYYGKMQTRGFNYSVILSDMRPEAPTSKPVGATEYRFDIYSSTSSAFNKTHKVPVGTYRIDHRSSGEPSTIDGSLDWSYLFDAADNQTPYLDATLVVTEESIIADVTLSNGDYHHIEYYGSNAYEDYVYDTYADIYPVSQHTKDVNFNVTGGAITAFYRADWFGLGMDNWYVYMIENKSNFSGQYLSIDFIIPKSNGVSDNYQSIVGEYTIFSEKPTDYSYTIPAGYLRDDGLQIGGWYATCVNAQVDMSTAAPFCGGTVKVENTGGYNYKFTIDSFDDNGNKIQGTFEAVLDATYEQNFD